jgi:ketosteroid isomerase-like protein
MDKHFKEANGSPKTLQNAFVAALNANNAQGMADCYASGSISFPVGEMIGHGPEYVAEAWTGFFSAFNVVEARLSEGHMETHGDTAIAWGFFTIIAEPAQGGEAVEMAGRYMDVARKIDGSWLYVADHASIPPAVPAISA